MALNIWFYKFVPNRAKDHGHNTAIVNNEEGEAGQCGDRIMTNQKQN